MAFGDVVQAMQFGAGLLSGFQAHTEKMRQESENQQLQMLKLLSADKTKEVVPVDQSELAPGGGSFGESLFGGGQRKTREGHDVYSFGGHHFALKPRGVDTGGDDVEPQAPAVQPTAPAAPLAPRTLFPPGETPDAVPDTPTAPTAPAAPAAPAAPKGRTTLPTRLNNPLAITLGEQTKHHLNKGATVDQQATDSTARFLKFPTMEAGWAAADELLRGPLYSELTVDDALKKWSNNGYSAAKVLPNVRGAQIDPTKKIGDLDDKSRKALMQAMALHEGFQPNRYANTPEKLAADQGRRIATTTDPTMAQAAQKLTPTITPPATGAAPTTQAGAQPDTSMMVAGPGAPAPKQPQGYQSGEIEKPPEFSGRVLGRFPGALPGFPGRPIMEHKGGKGTSSHLNMVSNIDGKEYIIPSMYNGKVVTEDEAKAIIKKNNFVDPETGYKLRGYDNADEALKVEKQWHDAIDKGKKVPANPGIDSSAPGPQSSAPPDTTNTEPAPGTFAGPGATPPVQPAAAKAPAGEAQAGIQLPPAETADEYVAKYHREAVRGFKGTPITEDLPEEKRKAFVAARKQARLDYDKMTNDVEKRVKELKKETHDPDVLDALEQVRTVKQLDAVLAYSKKAPEHDYLADGQAHLAREVAAGRGDKAVAQVWSKLKSLNYTDDDIKTTVLEPSGYNLNKAKALARVQQDVEIEAIPKKQAAKLPGDVKAAQVVGEVQQQQQLTSEALKPILPALKEELDRDIQKGVVPAGTTIAKYAEQYPNAVALARKTTADRALEEEKRKKTEVPGPIDNPVERAARVLGLPNSSAATPEQAAQISKNVAEETKMSKLDEFEQHKKLQLALDQQKHDNTEVPAEKMGFYYDRKTMMPFSHTMNWKALYAEDPIPVSAKVKEQLDAFIPLRVQTQIIQQLADKVYGPGGPLEGVRADAGIGGRLKGKSAILVATALQNNPDVQELDKQLKEFNYRSARVIEGLGSRPAASMIQPIVALSPSLGSATLFTTHPPDTYERIATSLAAAEQYMRNAAFRLTGQNPPEGRLEPRKMPGEAGAAPAGAPAGTTFQPAPTAPVEGEDEGEAYRQRVRPK